MLHSMFEDASFLQLIVSISAALFLLSLVRIYALGRENREMRKNNLQMEAWAGTQQRELVTIHHDAKSWRAKTQRQFDAVRAELSARLEQAERGNLEVQKQADAAQERALVAAMARIGELEEQLKTARATPAAAMSTHEIPALPAMETLRVESLQGEMSVAKAETEALRQRNAELQRALLLARRKHPSPRRNGSRPARQG